MEDGKGFEKTLLGFSKADRIEWTKRVVNTLHPVLAVPSDILAQMAKAIAKGDLIGFLDLQLYNYHEEVVVNGYLIMRVKDLEVRSKYLESYFDHVDCWATCDILKPKLSEKDKDGQFLKILEYAKDSRPFVRRIALVLLFAYVGDDERYQNIYPIVDELGKDDHYYVKMCAAWLLCELFIKRRSSTLDYLEINALPSFTVNKAIQKCRDSYRVSREDKDFLLKFKK